MTNINFDDFKQITKQGFSLDLIYILGLIEQGYSIKDELSDIQISSLRRKLLIDEEFNITERGKDLLKFSSGKSSKLATRTKDNRFDEWWKEAYIDSDNFTYKGRTFNGTQKKTIKKKECLALYEKLIKTGKYTEDEIINGTKNHMLTAKELSYKTGKNQVSYIGNSWRYLNEEMYSPFIGKKEQIIQEDYDGTNL